ncbi:MAG: efflux RND transporter periplasmic adaptor subunit [Proteobacteria bacterium]|nr:efflux RND transporter periplasmic adaptor subunit [Pseudomonadota bacterium]
MSPRTILRTLLPVLLALAIGWWVRGFTGSDAPARDSAAESTTGDSPCPGGAEPLYWRAPMDPTYVRNEPGKSPMDMDLVPECPAGGSAAPEGSIVIDPSTVQNIGVRTALAEIRDLSRSIRAVGRVAYDERRVAHVHTKVQGWVERLLVDYVGQQVERGQPLLEIYSPQLVATQEELLLAVRYRSATQESPFEDVRGGGEALFDATRRRLELWDIPERDVDRLLRTGEIQKTLTLYAPSAGVVTELGVRSGMEVQPNHNLYTIADLSSVWVLADVYEFELPWVELGQQASVELSYLPGETLTGPVTYISPFLDPKTRTAEVRIELPNPDGRLKPEMFGNTIIQGTPRPGVVAIPSEAVIRSGRRTLVIVARGEGRFEPRQIELGLDSGDGWVEIRGGLAAGDEIVVSSQFLIDSESRLQEAIKKLLAPSAGHEGE